MKILFLNPHIDAGHNLAKKLQSRGVALLTPADAAEAWQMLQLHGTSVDLAIVHRETISGAGEPGLQFINQAKSDPQQADLPIVLTTEKWSDAECATHQSSPAGANAYLHWPCAPEQLLQTIEAVTGVSLGAPKSSAPPKSAPKGAGAGSSATASGFVLEDPSSVFKTYEASDTSIKLEAPALPDSPAAETAAIEMTAPTAQQSGGAETASIALSLDLPGEQPEAASQPSIPTAEVSAPSELSIPTAELGATGIELGTIAEVPTASPTEISLGGSEGAAEASMQIDPQPTTAGTFTALGVTQKIEEPADDTEAAQEMPYIYGGAGRDPQAAALSIPGAIAFAQPVGDAVVPGGAAQSPDLETLKKYLLLREQDVAALSTQLKTAREQVSSLEELLRSERARNVELSHTVDEQKRKLDNAERDKELSLEALQVEMNDLRFQLKTKTDKSRVLDAQIRDAREEIERIKERVRADIRKIRIREKELENRLEIMKKDSEALITARETKIIELKRKLDLLEFNMDLLQDQYAREKETAQRLRERLAKVAQIVRVAGGLLDSKGNPVGSIEGDLSDLGTSDTNEDREAS